MTDFDAKRFKGFKYESHSNKYWQFQSQINYDKSKILVKVADSNLFSFVSEYSKWAMFGLKLDRDHLVFLKNWQVFEGSYGTYILIDKNYWHVTNAKNPFDNMVEHADLSWQAELEVAREQQEATDQILVAKN